MRGLNMIETPAALYGSRQAAQSFARVKAIGANSVALVVFFWQADHADPNLVLGNAVPAERLRAGIAQARAAGLDVVVKPHVWVPETWAGAVRLDDAGEREAWFAAYRDALGQVAEIAQFEGASTLVIGTELRGMTRWPQWQQVIAATRARFAGRLTYVAHGAQEAANITFWDQLDTLGVSLYPALRGGSDRAAWRAAMARELATVQRIARQVSRPFWIGEIGLRSAAGATQRPWESAEERAAPAAPALQAAVLETWLDQARQFEAQGVYIWRWFSDPDGGGAEDTDFTVQNKPAEEMLRRRWLRN